MGLCEESCNDVVKTRGKILLRNFTWSPVLVFRLSYDLMVRASASVIVRLGLVVRSPSCRKSLMCHTGRLRKRFAHADELWSYRMADVRKVRE